MIVSQEYSLMTEWVQNRHASWPQFKLIEYIIYDISKFA